MQQITENIIISETFNDLKVVDQPVKSVEDYSILLENHGVEFAQVGYHLQVGEIREVQGWILHISIVRSQIPEVLNILIPKLTSENIPFKIAKDKETARNILDGNLGKSQVGKVVSIYPVVNMDIVTFAKELVEATKPYKGPAVLTDIHLGGLVYTRYGSFDQIIMSDEGGKEDKYIYNQKGDLIKDIENIPFELSTGINWPFAQLANQKVLPKSKILNQIYRPIVNLKSDPRGNVIKALYLKNLFEVKWCVIKQGVLNMWSDEYGRDIPDRLLWQKELHNKLERKIPLPKILDFFTENGNSYLVMEYIKGKSLHDRLSELNFESQSWKYWKRSNQIIALGYLMQLIDVVSHLHLAGFVHRDITPVNFIIDNNDRLILIDIELAYSLQAKEPSPPFIMGTYGFMSPEQMATLPPTIKEDIYGLGATLVNIFTGLVPITLLNQHPDYLVENLYFFIGDYVVSRMIAACIRRDSDSRPPLSEIRRCFEQYLQALSVKNINTNKPSLQQTLSTDELKRIIQSGINGLSEYPTLLDNDLLWLCRMPPQDNDFGKQEKAFGISGGFSEGLSGILYFLAAAKQKGFDISSCQKSYNKGWDYINKQYLQILPNIPPGLYGGAAGIALALSEGISAGLLEDTPENRNLVHQCLELPYSGMDLANGIAGQGLAALECQRLLGIEKNEELLYKTKYALLNEQKKQGYWIRFKDKAGKRSYAYSFANGNTGILWFLLHYMERYEDAAVKQAVIKSMAYLLKSLSPIKRFMLKEGSRKVIAGKSEYLDGIKGALLVLIKSYEILKNPIYKEAAEEILYLFAANIINDNFHLNTGLASLGCLYLEAGFAFKNHIWIDRANSIAEILKHAINEDEYSKGYYWQGINSPIPTASFTTGNSGIVYFFLRHLPKESEKSSVF